MKKITAFFGNLFNFKKEGKLNVTKLVAFIVVAVVIVGAVIFGIKGVNNPEKVLTAKLSELGTDFYENFYYDQLGKSQEEREETLKKFSDKGIKIDLDNLIRLNSDNSEDLKSIFVNKKTGSSCDAKSTKVIIYPKESYGKKDYKIETVLECGFKTKTDKVEEK
jgi:hypothetical protein